MLKGSTGIQQVIFILAAVMVSAVIGVSLTTEGALGESINTGFEKISNLTATNSIVVKNNDVSGSAKQTMLSAMDYVYDRARDNGCDKVQTQNDDEDGYEGLAGTELGKFPSCAGGNRADLPIGDEHGNDAEGLYSRVSFTIKENFTLNNPSNTYGARDGGYKELTRRNKDDGGWLSDEFVSDPDNFIVFYRFEDNNQRASHFLKYFGGWKEGQKDTYESWGGEPNYHNKELWDSYDAKFRFCEGDEGYIQMNKEYPSETGEVPANSDFFPHIVVEKKGTNCGNFAKVEEDALKGNTLLIMNKKGDHARFPSPDNYENPWINLTNKNEFSIADEDPIDNPSQRCSTFIKETELVNRETNGLISFEKGTLIEKDGKFPSVAEDYKEMSTLNDNAVEDVWDNLKTKGFNGKPTKGLDANTKHKDIGPITYYQRYRLHGDLLCVSKDITETSQAKWFLCGANLEQKEIEMDETYQCENGDWIEE